MPAHHAEADLARELRRLVDLFDRVAVHVDHVVEEAHAVRDDSRESLPVEAWLVAFAGDEAAEVERAEVAGLVWKQRLLSARIGRLDLPEVWRRVVAIDAVDEDDTGVAIPPGVGDNQVKDVPRPPAGGHFAAARVHQVVLFVVLDGAHELLGDRDRDVEVDERAHVALDRDELLDVWVVNGKDAHVGAAPGAPLLDRLSRRVEHL